MKQVLIATFIFISLALNAQSMSTGTISAVPFNGKYYATVLVKMDTKDQKVTQISISNMEDATLRDLLAAQYDVLFKQQSVLTKASAVNILNLFATQGFTLVSASSAAIGTELYTTYVMYYSL